MKQCINCFAEFSPKQDDLDFYKKIGVPEPTHCPDCRQQRRLAWRNERKLYRRNCDNCKSSIISCYSPEKPLIVYCNACWWSDAFDPYAYGRDFDFQKTFFEQFAELQKSVPHFALFQDNTSENCEYTNYGFGNKSCYMSLCFKCEDVYYSHAVMMSKDCMDTTKMQSCELCYECVDCISCSRLLFSRNCERCHESALLVNCRNSKNCFGSINLNHKEYVFFNKQLTREEYEEKMRTIEWTPEKISEFMSEMNKQWSESIHRNYTGTNNNNCVGNYLDHCENCYNCFDTIDMRDSAYCSFGGSNSHNLYDCNYVGVGSSFCYETVGFTNSNNLYFQYYGRNNYDAYYSQYCFSSHHLFGAIGMNHGQHVILNKKYEPEEYEALKQKIINHMKKTGEYGEFFPIQLSPYGYNETVAQEYFPLSREAALKKGYKWKEIQQDNSTTSTGNPNIKKCKNCNQNYQIIEQEKKFYNKFQLPLPQYCPECRHNQRFSLRAKRKIWNRNCAKCQKKTIAFYSTEEAKIVYCEECYAKEVC